MMMLKVTGGLLILFGCAGIGGYVVMKNSMRIRLLRELERALFYIYGEIEYAASDMVEIMERLSFRGGALGEFFLNMKGRILSHQGLRLCDYWAEEMKGIQGIESLKESDVEFIRQIGENLGNMDRMTQLRTLENFQSRLSGMIQLAEKEYHGKAKISMVIGITGGIFLVILLL